MANSLTTEKQNKILPLLISFATAVVLLLVCSQASPIYPIQRYPDVQCFFTIGRSMLHGAVPYRDIMDHKGPLLYFLFEGIAWINESSQIGLWFVEIICATIFLYFSWKILQLFSSANPIWIFAIGVFTYSTFAINTGGDVEELALPALSYAFYIILRSMKENKPISIKSSFIVGLTASVIFWIKFTIFTVYLGFLIVILIFRLKKDKLKILNICWSVFLGFVVITMPILIYFSSNNAISDLFTVYFYDNLAVYQDSSTFSFLIYEIVAILLNNIYALIAIAFSIPFFIKKETRKYLWTILIIAFTYFIFVFIGGRIYCYYCAPYSIFIPFGIAYIDTEYKKAITKYDKEKTKSKKALILSIPHTKIFIVIICILGYALTFFTTPASTLLLYDKDELVQVKFAEIINQKENATLLNYGMLDYGFYTSTGIIPNCKYFCGINLPLDEIKEGQDTTIKNQSVDFIITVQKENNLETNYSRENIDENTTMENMFEEYGYYLIEKYYSKYENGTFYLYELED